MPNLGQPSGAYARGPAATFSLPLPPGSFQAAAGFGPLCAGEAAAMAAAGAGFTAAEFGAAGFGLMTAPQQAPRMSAFGFVSGASGPEIRPSDGGSPRDYPFVYGAGEPMMDMPALAAAAGGAGVSGSYPDVHPEELAQIQEAMRLSLLQPQPRGWEGAPAAARGSGGGDGTPAGGWLWQGALLAAGEQAPDFCPGVLAANSLLFRAAVCCVEFGDAHFAGYGPCRV